MTAANTVFLSPPAARVPVEGFSWLPGAGAPRGAARGPEGRAADCTGTRPSWGQTKLVTADQCAPAPCQVDGAVISETDRPHKHRVQVATTLAHVVFLAQGRLHRERLHHSPVVQVVQPPTHLTTISIHRDCGDHVDSSGNERRQRPELQNKDMVVSPWRTSLEAPRGQRPLPSRAGMGELAVVKRSILALL